MVPPRGEAGGTLTDEPDHPSQTPTAPATEGASVRPNARERAQQASARAREASQELLTRAEDARSRSRTVDAAFKAYDRDRRVAGPLLGGALAFRLFLVILPLTLIVVGGFGLSSSRAVETRAQEIGLSAYVADMVDSAGSASSTNNIIAIVLGVVGLFFASRAMVKALRVMHALAWRLQPPRPGVSLRSTLLAMAALAGAWVASVAVGYLRHEVFGLVGSIAVSMLYTATVLVLIQWFMPHAEGVRLRDLWPGAALAAAGMLAINLATELYLIGKAASFSNLYGGLGVAAVLLLWLYLVARLLVAATVVNATMWFQDHS